MAPEVRKNKLKRQEIYQNKKREIAKEERKARQLRKKEEAADPSKAEERRRLNIPKTIENTRKPDETFVDAQEIEQQDLSGQAKEGERMPKVLVTTRKRPSTENVQFCHHLISVLPTAEFISRGHQFEMEKIIQFCCNRQYTDIVMIHDDGKLPTAMILIHLPIGPTAYFKLSSVKYGSKTSATSHHPELILKGFQTGLGAQVVSLLKGLFPPRPEIKGRQVCTFQNQRDYIFFRRHRYEYRNVNKASLKELGPRFTMKLKWLQKGTFDPKGGEFIWKSEQTMATKQSKTRFFL